ncbi:hypothetical protein psyc5s11_13110 [Clostridium gelidum]|uniref:DUF2572 family protein n=1 Tax=Clostridium gelidum TaxID=704125 RepID=A0ABM7T089_9CLOT|nr:hypothetical protein [Clostridium gelidum]BCZ45244.1 hypothetical protein psyc5s11_13110 [Clostridium gelidum]
MVRKKRGSSLVTVVIISGILITVGTAMLSMTIGDYKMRTTESTRIENLYSSESGLDVAYDVLIKTFDAAAIYGVNQVEKYKKTDGFTIVVAKDRKADIVEQERIKASIPSDATAAHRSSIIKECNKRIAEDNKQIKIEEDLAINAYFKNTFNEFIYKNSSADINKNELKRCIDEHKYAINLEKENRDDTDYTTVEFNNSNTILINVHDVNTENIKLESINFEAGNSNGDYSNGKYPNGLCPKEKGKYTIKIQSDYETKDKGPKGDKTKRTLQSTYDMTLPEYKDVVFSESVAEVAKQPFLIDKALLVGGNMEVKESPLSVKGNIFVQGNGYNDIDEVGIDRAYNKYNGGIVLNSDSSKKKIIFNGDVITGKTFNIRNNVESTINGNLYAMNVYAGNEKATDVPAKNSTLYVSNTSPDANKNDVAREVMVDNDITLKSDSTHITIDKFYGINDKNIKYSDATGTNGDDKQLGRTSSSIIVNVLESSNSGIKINTEAYIMGVAHINTNTTNGYSTGESTGVKDNYIAYSVPSVDKGGNVDTSEKFDYYDPLQLLKEDNVIKKSEHFKKYWDLNEGIHTGGIQLPERTHSIGAIVKRDGTVGSSTLAYVPDEVKIKQKEFASKVYNIGGESLTDEDKQSLYESLGSQKDLVSDLMDIEGACNQTEGSFYDYMQDNKIFFTKYNVSDTPNEENNNEKAIFSDKNIKIKESTEQSIVKDPDDENGIIIKVPSNTTLNAFIATSGDVTIKGNVNIKGSIIAEGNLTFNPSEGQSIEYNKELLDRIQALNVEIFNSVFGHMRESNPVNLNVEYDVNKFIKNSRWKIIK